jgi:hypothetical protein
MADPQIAARYVLDRCTPPEIREELERRLGAREGDTVVMFEDGSVGLGRNVDGADAVVLNRLIRSLLDQASPSPPRPLRPRRDRHLRVEK